MSDSTELERERFNAFAKSARLDTGLWLLLVALGAASLALAYIRLGPFNLVVGLAIAAMQISIIGLFFMKLRHARALIALTAGAAFIFVFVMFAFTFNDLFTRH